MKKLFVLSIFLILTSITAFSQISKTEVEAFFAKHPVDGLDVFKVQSKTPGCDVGFDGSPKLFAIVIRAAETGLSISSTELDRGRTVDLWIPYSKLVALYSDTYSLKILFE